MAAPVLLTATDVTVGVTAVSKILSMDWSGIERGVVDVTHTLSSVAREFIPTDLYDPGAVTFEVEFDPTDNQPLDDLVLAAATVTIDMAGLGTPNLWSASGFMTSFSISGTNEEMMTASIGVKFTGVIAVA